MNQQQAGELSSQFKRIRAERGDMRIDGNVLDEKTFIDALSRLDDFEVVNLISDLSSVIQNIEFRDSPTTYIPPGELKRPSINVQLESGGTEYTLDLRWNRN